jgi:hypothetical protein
MVRYLIAAVVGCLYVVGSVLIVQRVGKEYRAGLNPNRLAAKIVPNTRSPGVKDETSPLVPAANPTSTPSKSALIDAAPPPVTVASRKTTGDHPAPIAPTIETARVKSVLAPPKKNADAHPEREAAPVDPLANDPFWNKPELKKQWDITYLKPDDERQLCEILHAVIVHFNPLVADPTPWLSRVEEAAEPFYPKLQRKGIKYKFFILDSDVVNAFSIPGGKVYISRGLFNLIGEDEDYALEFAIGHEIAHVDLEHAIECLRMPGMKELPRGTMFKLYLLILPFGYVANEKVNQEFAADDWVSNKMTQIGRTRREILVFLQKLEGYSNDRGFFGGRMPPQPGRDLSPVENHYRAQISARERLKHLKELMGQSVTAQKETPPKRPSQ